MRSIAVVALLAACSAGSRSAPVAPSPPASGETPANEAPPPAEDPPPATEPETVIDVCMPRSDQADDSARYLLVSIAVDGSVEVAGSPVTDDALVEILEAAHQNDPDTKVVLGAADRVPYGRVVAVIDQVKRAGLTQIALARRE